jgi:ABC-type multidrug transport system fused ATPase/permease subunit
VLVSQVGQRFVYDIRRDLFAHVQRLSLQFHGSRRSGDLMSRLTGDITSLQDLVVIGVSNALGNGMTIALMVVVMLRLDWRYTLVALVIVPFMYLAARYYRTAIKQASRQVRRSEGQVSSIVQEVISSIRVVKAFAREDFEQERFEQQTNQSVQANLRTARLQAQFAPIISILATLSMVVVLWLGVREVVARRLTAGELLVFVSYFRALSSPLRQLAKLSTITAREPRAPNAYSKLWTQSQRCRTFLRRNPPPPSVGILNSTRFRSATIPGTWCCTTSPSMCLRVAPSR